MKGSNWVELGGAGAVGKSKQDGGLATGKVKMRRWKIINQFNIGNIHTHTHTGRATKVRGA